MVAELSRVKFHYLANAMILTTMKYAKKPDHNEFKINSN